MDYWPARATGHFRVTDLDKPSETRSGTARTRNEGRWWAVGWSAAWPPPWPGDVPPLGIPRIRSDVVVFHRLPWNRVTSRHVRQQHDAHRLPPYVGVRSNACTYIHAYVPDPDTHRHTIDVCARRSNNYGHRDIGLRRTYDEGTRNAYERTYAVRATWSARTLPIVRRGILLHRRQKGYSLRNGTGIIDTWKVARSLGIFNDPMDCCTRDFELLEEAAPWILVKGKTRTFVFSGFREGHFYFLCLWHFFLV